MQSGWGGRLWKMGVSSGSHFLSPGIQGGAGGDHPPLRPPSGWGTPGGSPPAGAATRTSSPSTRGATSTSPATTSAPTTSWGMTRGSLDDPASGADAPGAMSSRWSSRPPAPPTEEERQATRDDVATPGRPSSGGEELLTLGSDSPLSWPAWDSTDHRIRAFRLSVVTPHGGAPVRHHQRPPLRPAGNHEWWGPWSPGRSPTPSLVRGESGWRMWRTAARVEVRG